MTTPDEPFPAEYPARLVREARRAAERLELALVGQAMALGTALAKWLGGDLTNPVLITGAIGAALTLPVTLLLRRRYLHRAYWLATTERWWLHLDAMPRLDPFPRLVDWIESHVTDPVRRLARRLRPRRKPCRPCGMGYPCPAHDPRPPA